MSARVKLKSPIFYQEVDSDGDTSGWSRLGLHPVEKKPLMSRRSKVHLKVVGVLLKVQKLLSRMVILISNVGNYCKNVELCWNFVCSSRKSSKRTLHTVSKRYFLPKNKLVVYIFSAVFFLRLNHTFVYFFTAFVYF